LINSERIWDPGATLASILHWFETELPTRNENLIELMAQNRGTARQAESPDGSDHVVLNMDSSESPIHGEEDHSRIESARSSNPAGWRDKNTPGTELREIISHDIYIYSATWGTFGVGWHCYRGSGTGP